MKQKWEIIHWPNNKKVVGSESRELAEKLLSYYGKDHIIRETWFWDDVSTELARGKREANKSLRNLKVFVNFGTSRLGDTIAWIPAVEKFQRENSCEVFCSTYHNELFKNEYPEITFLEPKSISKNLDEYDDGWKTVSNTSEQVAVHYYSDRFDVVFDFMDIIQWPFDKGLAIQEIAHKALGLEFDPLNETVARITVKEEELELKKPYVCISTQSLAQCKFWNYPNGWAEIIQYLKSRGYGVVCVDKKQHYKNTISSDIIFRHDKIIEETIGTINGAEFLIGLSSGLSWVAWGLNKHVVLISGFTDENHEFKTKCERVFNSNVCNNCFGKYPLDPQNWDWCPDQENTERMFECTKQITPDMVKSAINNVIQHK